MSKRSPLQELVNGQGLTIWIVDAWGRSSTLTIPLSRIFRRLGARTFANTFTHETFDLFDARKYERVRYPRGVKYLLLGTTDLDECASFKLIDCTTHKQISIAIGAEKYLEHRQRKPSAKAMHLYNWLEDTLLQPMMISHVTD